MDDVSGQGHPQKPPHLLLPNAIANGVIRGKRRMDGGIQQKQLHLPRRTRALQPQRLCFPDLQSYVRGPGLVGKEDFE